MITRQQKEEQLSQIIEQMREAKSITFVQYGGLTVQDIGKVRGQLREKNGTLRVIKKTLITRAVKQLYEIEMDPGILEGQVAVVCSNEEVTDGPKILKTLSKEHKVIQLEGGIFEGKLLDKGEIKQLADLPSKEELVAKLLGSLMSPIQGFYGTNKAVLSGFARVLDGHRENLENQA